MLMILSNWLTIKNYILIVIDLTLYCSCDISYASGSGLIPSAVTHTETCNCMFCVAVSSSGKSDTLMSAGTCSFTCQDFINMKNSLLQLKLKLGNTHPQSPNQVTCLL